MIAFDARHEQARTKAFRRPRTGGADVVFEHMSKISIPELLELSVEERIQLVEDLWDSIAADPEAIPLTELQRREIERRRAEHEKDPSSVVPWEEVRERLRQLFG